MSKITDILGYENLPTEITDKLSSHQLQEKKEMGQNKNKIISVY